MNEPSDATQRDVVLVVDDAPETLSLLTDALEAGGMTVLVATDGATALARVQRIVPDVILLDAVMPGMDGFETCAAMRSMPALAQVPIIFMTGLADAEHVVRGFDSGGVDYVTKPIDPDVLIARLRTHLANARRMSTARAALDAAGRALLAVSLDGRVQWSTPKAQAFMTTATTSLGDAQQLAVPLVVWLQALANGGQESRPRSWPENEPRFLVTSLGTVGNGQVLLAVEATDEADHRRRLGEKFHLTERESEVLYWVARGKSSRDVGDILGSSPRTVDKHIERILVKLGVENRAAAAAVAMRLLSAE